MKHKIGLLISAALALLFNSVAAAEAEPPFIIVNRSNSNGDHVIVKSFASPPRSPLNSSQLVSDRSVLPATIDGNGFVIHSVAANGISGYELRSVGHRAILYKDVTFFFKSGQRKPLDLTNVEAQLQFQFRQDQGRGFPPRWNTSNRQFRFSGMKPQPVVVNGKSTEWKYVRANLNLESSGVHELRLLVYLRNSTPEPKDIYFGGTRFATSSGR